MDTPFRRYWIGRGLSLLGDQVRALALPLTAVLTLHADATGMALLGAVGSIPALLFSVHAGAWVDRRGRRRQMMIAADIARALLLAGIPVLFALRLMTLPILLGIAFLFGSCSLLFRVSASSLFVALVPRERYVEASALLSGANSMAFLAGPAIGGVLVQILTAPLALLADAVSFVASALSLGCIRPEEPPPAERARGDLMAGLNFIRRTPVLRAAFGAEATTSLFRAAFFALYILYATRMLHVTPVEWGIILGPSSIGALVASAFAGRIGRRLGLGRTMLLGTLYTIPALLVPLAAGSHALVVAVLFTSELLTSAGFMVREIADGTIKAAAVPDALRARTSAAFVTVSSGLRPFGALLGGVLAAAIGLRMGLLVVTAGGALAFLWFLPLPLDRLHAVEDLTPASAAG